MTRGALHNGDEGGLGERVRSQGGPIVADAYHQVKARLNELVENYAADGRYQLPPEDQLSASLGVSRPTIRSALLSLQKEGRIQRFHGRGTFINRYALRMRANVSEDRPFLQLLTRLGYKSAVRTVSLQRVALPDAVTTALEIAAAAPGIAIERVFEADGRPAVFSVDYVPESLITGDPSILEAGKSTFEFVAANTAHKIQYSVAELVPTLPPSVVSTNLGLGAKNPLLLISHLHVDAAQRPIAVTEAYLNDTIIRFSVVRTYLDS